MSGDVFPPILDQARDWIRRVLGPGDLAVDATVGNGHDTLFLAECVGSTGRVIGFDIQRAALEETSRRLREARVGDRVLLFERSHEEIFRVLEAHSPTVRPRAVMFNLGYRPGGDHRVLTRPETTIAGLIGGLEVVAPGGIVTVVLYPGHEGGQTESEAVLDLARALPAGRARVVTYRFLNTKSAAPFLLAFTPSRHEVLPLSP
jgi:Putative rRNA methylase